MLEVLSSSGESMIVCVYLRDVVNMRDGLILTCNKHTWADGITLRVPGHGDKDQFIQMLICDVEILYAQ